MKALVTVANVAVELLQDKGKADLVSSIALGQSVATIRAGLKQTAGDIFFRIIIVN